MSKKRYKNRNQFRYSKSKKTGYHPHYVFGEDNNNYISIGLTTHPSKKMVVSEIKSPNPNYNGKQYIQLKPFKMKKALIRISAKKAGVLIKMICR